MICVECGAPVPHLFQEYSRGNIRLTKCKNCGSHADVYVEYELSVLLIDLILHRPQVYRHLLFNLLPRHSHRIQVLLLKALAANVALDACCHVAVNADIKASVLELVRSGASWQPHFFFDSLIRPASRMMGEALVVAIANNLGHLSTVSLGAVAVIGYWQLARGMSQDLRDHAVFLLAICISNFFKLVALLIVVWGYGHVIRVPMALFTWTSNVLAVSVVTRTGLARSASSVALGTLIELAMSRIIHIHSLFPPIRNSASCITRP